MEKKPLKTNVSFADSKYNSFQRDEEGNLVIYMNSWEEEPFQVIFIHAIQFLFRLGDIPKGIYEFSNHSSFLQEALFQEYGYIPVDHPYKLFQIEDIDNFPFIEVVAESISILR